MLVLTAYLAFAFSESAPPVNSSESQMSFERAHKERTFLHARLSRPGRALTCHLVSGLLSRGSSRLDIARELESLLIDGYRMLSRMMPCCLSSEYLW
jgi:hypothetical protein